MPDYPSLSDVKINNSYNYYRNVIPTAAEKTPTYTTGQTWLNLTTGFSYVLSDDVTGTWDRIEQDIDEKINAIKNDTFETVIAYIGNFFKVKRTLDYSTEYSDTPTENFLRQDEFELFNYESVYSEFTFDAGTKKITGGDNIYGGIADSYNVGDIILILGSLRNDGYYTITALSALDITVSEDLTNSTSYCFTYLSNVKSGFLKIVGRMIHYDVYTRPKITGMKSEKIGTYSYTLQDIGGLGYPNDIVRGLDSYSDNVIGGVSNFVN